MQKRWIILGCIAALVLAGLAALVLVEPRPGLSEDNFRRLRLGMPLERVESILGRASDESPFPGIHHWKGENIEIRVLFDPDEGVNSGFLATRGGDEIETLNSNWSLIRWILHR
jgi:hypothetical protein